MKRIRGYISLIITMAVLVTLSSTSVMAKATTSKACHHMKAHHEQEMQDFIKQVGLTPEQKQKVEAIKNNTRNQTKALRDSIFQKRMALMEYVATPQSSEDEALKQQQAIGALQQQISETWLKSMYQMKAVLTPEQQQKALQFVRKKRTEIEKYHQSWGSESP